MRLIFSIGRLMYFPMVFLRSEVFVCRYQP